MMNFPAASTNAVRHASQDVARVMHAGAQFWPVAVPVGAPINTSGPLESDGSYRPAYQMRQEVYPVEPVAAQLNIVTPAGNDVFGAVITNNSNANTWEVAFPSIPGADVGAYRLVYNAVEVARHTATAYVAPPDLSPWFDPDGSGTLADDAGDRRLSFADYAEIVLDHEEVAGFDRDSGDVFTFSLTLRNVTAPMTLSYLMRAEYYFPYVDDNYEDKVTAIAADAGEVTYTFSMAAADWTLMVDELGASTNWVPWLGSDVPVSFTLVSWSIA